MSDKFQVYRSVDELPRELRGTVLSVGNFDGVHCAHRAVLREVVSRARAMDYIAMAVTFDPHPMRVLRPDIATKLLTPLPLKLKALATTGLDAALVLPFTRDLSLMAPRDFAQRLLAEKLSAKEVHEGSNFHFGHKAAGNVEKLAEFGREFGFVVKIYDEMKMRGQTVSSSRIRHLLAGGKVELARRLLGRVFSIIAHPGRGRGYGHKYTVPTINLSEYGELVPANGVYVTRTRVDEETFDSVTNVGVRPTFGEESFAIETHLLNFHPIDVTAQTEVEIAFLLRLRDEMKFPSVETLREQISCDVKRARRFFQLCKTLVLS